jgi:hypothetical protein
MIIKPIHNSAITFELKHKDITIGTLEYKNKIYNFYYSNDYKSLSNTKVSIPPILDFPDVNKVYSSSELWPFFLSRIPNHLKHSNSEWGKLSTVELLVNFGERTINNPYLLMPLKPRNAGL